MRKPKPKPVVRPQFAAAGYAAAAAAEPEDDQAEHAFESEPESVGRITPVAIDPTTSLELLRHYHAQGDALRFEELAESLHAHVAEDSPEWQEVSAMGAALAPQHPLFVDTTAGESHFTFEPMPDAASAHEDMHTRKMELPNFRADEVHTDGVHAFEASPALHEDEAPAVHESAEHEDAVFTHEATEDGTPMPARETGLNEFLAEEDTIGTRLDLARAYLDMGDPDGARSMLDEVLAEGNEAQKEEARKLLAELH